MLSVGFYTAIFISLTYLTSRRLHDAIISSLKNRAENCQAEVDTMARVLNCDDCGKTPNVVELKKKKITKCFARNACSRAQPLGMSASRSRACSRVSLI